MNIPMTAERTAPKMVHSKVTGMKAGHELSGRPPMFDRIGDDGYPVLEREAAEPAEDAAEQDDERHRRW